MANYKVKNVTPMRITINLRSQTRDSNSVELAPRAVSRALTQDEFKSEEVQRGIAKRALRDVTGKA